AVRAGADATAVLDRVCARARELTGARAVAVLDATPDGTLAVRAVAGRHAGWRRGTRVPDGSAAHRATGSREPVRGGGGMLFVPLPRYGPGTGVLAAAYRQPEPATERE